MLMLPKTEQDLKKIGFILAESFKLFTRKKKIGGGVIVNPIGFQMKLYGIYICCVL